MSTNNSLPSRDEQKSLLHVDSLLRSNLLSLQVKELLDQVELKESSKDIIRNVGKDPSMDSVWVQSLLQLLKCPVAVDFEVSNDWLNNKGYNGLTISSKSNSAINFKSPENVEIIGSYSSDTVTSPISNIDVAITLPSDIFDQRDILNHIYFDKRTNYLAGICYNLLENHDAPENLASNKKKKRKANLESFISKYEVTIASFKGDARKTILIIKPSAIVNLSSAIEVRIIPVLTSGVFKISQLISTKNNVRPFSWMEKIKLNKAKGVQDKERGLDSSKLPGTPQYNAAIVEDIVILTHNQILLKTITPHQNLRNAVMLFKVWQTQRSARFLPDGFDGHDAALLLAYLVQIRRVSIQSTPLIAFQTMLSFISEFDFANKYIDFTSPEVTDKQMNDLMKDWPVVLTHPVQVHSSGTNSIIYNAYWRVSYSSIMDLKDEAMCSIREIQRNHESCFDYLFMQKRSFFDRFDLFFHIPVMLNKETHDTNHSEIKQEIADSLLHINPHIYYSSKLLTIIQEALGDRAVSVRSYVRNLFDEQNNDKTNTTRSSAGKKLSKKLSSHHPIWNLNSSQVSSLGFDVDDSSDKTEAEEPFLNAPDNIYKTSWYKWVITIGIVVSKEKGARKVDRNQSTATKEYFTHFWGPKSQLRRFQDGSIVDAVVWDGSTSSMLTRSFNDNSSHNNALLRSDVIIDEIVRYIIPRHLPIICNDNSIQSQNIISITPFDLEIFNISENIKSQSINKVKLSYSEDIHSTRIAIASLDKLRSILSSEMKGLPLGIESLSAISPELRFTALHPPQPNPIVLGSSKEVLKPYFGQTISLLASPIRVLAKLETSGKWPKEAVAIQKLKLGLLLKMRSELRKQYKIQSVIHQESLDICYDGFIFRIVLVAGNDIETICLGDDDNDNDNSNNNKTSSAQEQINNDNKLEETQALKNTVAVLAYSIPPIYHLAIRNLHSIFPSYSASVKLLATWIANHYFSGHIAHEVLELIVAHVFLRPSGINPPTTSLIGFQQALRLLSSHNWDSEPLIIDLSESQSDISPSNRLEIDTRFRSMKNLNHFEQLSMYIISSADKMINFIPSIAMNSIPNKVILGMIITQSQQSLLKLNEYIQCDALLRNSMQSNDNLQNINKTFQNGDFMLINDIMKNNSILQTCNVILETNKNLCWMKKKDGSGLDPPLFARLQLFSNSSSQETAVTNLIV
eukprot:gene14271-19147_t